MRKRIPQLLALCCTLITVNAIAFTTQQHDAVSALGELNGVSLQCGYRAESQRLKQALVDAVPKVSQLGELFDEATQKSFLAMVHQGQPCPGLADLHGRVDTAIETLQRAYAAPAQP